MGATWKKFDMFSDDGIRFMGCGLYDNSPEDNVLFIEKEIDDRNPKILKGPPKK
jgi:hypothetical protein